MQILLTRLDNKRHRLEIVRADGSRESAELETRSLLLHDLVHLAVEAEAAIEDGFWGTLAAGGSFASLRVDSWDDAPAGIRLAETLVGPMQSLWQSKGSAERYVAHAGHVAPFVDEAFVARVFERLRRLWGHWRATSFHETMEVRWPPSP